MMINCPYCSKEIMPNAKRCRHCHEWLDEDARQSLAPFAKQTDVADSHLVKCPYCAEQIQADAKKCRFCGEWLEEATNRAGTDSMNSGSVDARAVAKGIKKQKQDEATLQGCGCLSLIGGVGIGSAIGGDVGGYVGIAVFVIGVILAFVIYHQE